MSKPTDSEPTGLSAPVASDIIPNASQPFDGQISAKNTDKTQRNEGKIPYCNNISPPEDDKSECVPHHLLILKDLSFI